MSGFIPTLHDQGRVSMGGHAAPRTVQGRNALYVNQTPWKTRAGDVLGPFYLFSFNARRSAAHPAGGPQLYLYLKANTDWFLYTTGINDAYMQEWASRVGWRRLLSQSALNSMGKDLQERVGRAVAGTLAQEAVSDQRREQEDRAQASIPSGGIGQASNGGGMATAGTFGGGGALPGWVKPVGAAAAVTMGALWWRDRGQQKRLRRGLGKKRRR